MSGLLDNLYMLGSFVKIAFFSVWTWHIVGLLKKKRNWERKPNRLKLHHSNKPEFATFYLVAFVWEGRGIINSGVHLIGKNVRSTGWVINISYKFFFFQKKTAHFKCVGYVLKVNFVNVLYINIQYRRLQNENELKPVWVTAVLKR